MKRKILVFCTLLLISAFTFAQTDTESSLLEKARTAEDNQDYEQAVKWFKKANTLNPKNGDTYYDLAWCQNELSKYEEAEKTAAAGAKILPTAKLYVEYGYALYMQGKYPTAIEKYKQALAMNADESAATKGLADAYFENAQYEPAIPYYKKCLDIKKDPKNANYKLGYIMNEQAKYQRAVEYELAAIKEDEEYAAAYNELGYAYSQLNQKSTALDNYIKASNLNPNSATYAANVADIYFNVESLKDLDQALDYYKKSLSVDNSSTLSNYRVGWILNDKSRYDEAKTYLNKAVTLNPKYSDAWVELGWVEYSKDNYNTAESDLQKAIQYNSQSELGIYYLGLLYAKQGKTGNLRKLIDELSSMNSKYADKLREKL